MPMNRDVFVDIIENVLGDITHDLEIPEKYIVHVTEDTNSITFRVEMIQSYSDYVLIFPTTIQKSMFNVSVSPQFMETWIYHIVLKALRQYRVYKTERDFFILEQEFLRVEQDYLKLKATMEEARKICKERADFMRGV